MQQTETYQLNLIDPSDDFSPEPLNANARAIETKLSAVEKGLDSVEDNLSAIGTPAQIRSGTVQGNGSSVTLNLEKFKPMVVFLGLQNSSVLLFVRDFPDASGASSIGKVVWTENGFTYTNAKDPLLMAGTPIYVAIGVDL